uniref:Beta-ketoacyl-[acyl-carrier-protein] synthase III n=1 Tax=Compsopogon caeruleus TaxID=31354 RepID=A0A1Z1XAU6_9RHOD|nr:beta-ketoacyl-acyl carrier protein synthase III [Compsopogon caeruleus]ARX95983.1 beta-ketoacyl-acyl carrier protein synthase III [Compsopogon caeruleus]
MAIKKVKPILCSYLPNNIISNEIISQMVDTSDEWIKSRTGIEERRICKDDYSLVDLGSNAALEAIKKGNIDPAEIDLIILATSTPDDLFGSAAKIQYRIKAFNAAAFDITAACSGFIIGIITASQFINTGIYKTVLVIGADVMSKFVDWQDRSTCILFGDGAGAAILKSTIKQHILGFQIKTNGELNSELTLSSKDLLQQNIAIQVFNRQYNFIQMNGKEIYKFAISKVPEAILNCLNTYQIQIEDIDWLLLHQANIRILKAIGEQLSIPQNKILNNLYKYGNTSAASIPIALDEAILENKIQDNDLIIMAGFGAGLTWGTVIIKWKDKLN